MTGLPVELRVSANVRRLFTRREIDAALCSARRFAVAQAEAFTEGNVLCYDEWIFAVQEGWRRPRVQLRARSREGELLADLELVLRRPDLF